MYHQHMSGTSFRALIEAGAKEDTAKEAADDSDRIDKTLAELKISVRIIIAILFVMIGIQVKILTVL